MFIHHAVQLRKKSQKAICEEFFKIIKIEGQKPVDK